MRTRQGWSPSSGARVFAELEEDDGIVDIEIIGQVGISRTLLELAALSVAFQERSRFVVPMGKRELVAAYRRGAAAYRHDRQRDGPRRAIALDPDSVRAIFEFG